jgi:hypothetical protein
MATIDTILEQIGKADFDVHGLLKLRSAVEARLVEMRRDLTKQLDAMVTVFGGGEGGAPAAARPAGAKRGRKPGPKAASAKPAGKRGPKPGKKRGPKPGSWSKRAPRSGTHSVGKHSGLSVADAVRKAIESKGGKASATEIKKIFENAGDKRNLNFTLLGEAGAIKRVAFEQKKPGQKGRAAGIYAVA